MHNRMISWKEQVNKARTAGQENPGRHLIYSFIDHKRAGKENQNIMIA